MHTEKTDFRFRQFSVCQDLCAMKVGTDGVLLGAWASGGSHILDVGTGTGVIALMMAQRFTDAQILGIDIDEGAVLQATANVDASPFAGRVGIGLQSVQELAADSVHQGCYDSIVSNPPFFSNSLRAPDRQRTMARHTDTLTYEVLMQSARRLMDPQGEVSVIVPFDYRRRMDDAAILAGLFPSRLYAVRTAVHKSPRRFLLSYRLEPCSFDSKELTIGDDTYQQLTRDFYL